MQSQGLGTPGTARAPLPPNEGSRRILFVLALPALVTLGFWVVFVRAPERPRVHHSKPAEPRLEAPLRAAAPPVLEVSGRIPEPERAALAPVTPDEPAAEDESEASAKAGVETFEAIKARQDLEQARLHEQLEKRLAGQGVDTTWRRHAEAQLSLGVQGIAGNDLQLESTSCREDVCKTVIKHEGTQVDGDRLTRFIMATARGLEHHFKYEEGRLTVYSIRRDE